MNQTGGEGTAEVRLEDLVQQSPITTGGVVEHRGSFLQRAGKTLFYVVLAATCAALAALFVYLFTNSPSTAAFQAAASADTLRFRLIAEQQGAVFQHFVTGVEKVIVAIFLPILTAILGYLFGTREVTRTNSATK